MASTPNSKEIADMRDLAKFVDELYFPLSGLPPMTVFAGAWGYDHNNDTMQVVHVDNSPPPQLINGDNTSPSDQETCAPKRKIFKSSRNNELCQFCKNNGEPERIYLSHKLRDKRNRVLCPRLRVYTCKICGASGDNAHTILHCPTRQNRIFFEYLSSRSLSSAKAM